MMVSNSMGVNLPRRCKNEAAFRTTKRPAWCDQHITEILLAGGLTPVEPFTKRDAHRLMRCTTCGCEAHYRFDYVLDKNRIDEPVCRACYWRQWASDQRRLAFVAPIPVDIEKVRQHSEDNGLEYLGPLTTPSLPSDPHRIRCKRCSMISAKRWGDIGWGCQSCRQNPKRQTPAATAGAKNKNLLRNSDDAVVSWWDHDANPESLWQKAKLRSPQEAAWRCPKCATSFRKTIREMTSHLSSLSCPTCKAEWEQEYRRKQRELSTKTVADIPELAALWIDTTPANQVPVLDSGYYKFRCVNGHQSTRRPYGYMDGCSYCAAAETRKANAAKAATDPASTRLSPEISAQWHPSLNGRWKLAAVSPNSRRPAWWKDPICGHEWQATPRERDKYHRLRCPHCRTVLDSLAYYYPEIAAQWAPENSVSPWHIRSTTSQMVEEPSWVCPNDSRHRWKATPGSRVNGSTCPECQESGKSKVELAHLAEARRLFGNASSGKRIDSPAFVRRGAWTVDILVDLDDGRQLAIEYDGSYWHADKAGLDIEKSRDLIAAGLTVVRLREEPLAHLDIESACYHEITVYSTAPDPTGTMERVRLRVQL
ncbi:zinc-ribbon domain-containing protein [Gordonia aichiensis]